MIDPQDNQKERMHRLRIVLMIASLSMLFVPRLIDRYAPRLDAPLAWIASAIVIALVAYIVGSSWMHYRRVRSKNAAHAAARQAQVARMRAQP